MNNPGKKSNLLSPFEGYMNLLVILWTILITISLAWSIFRLKKETLELAKIQADITLTEDILYRRWNAMHGGVYVPVTEETQPNPYLSDVADRDITSLTGKRLTLINPAYMTRQVHDLMKGEHNVRGHITSLNPIRPENTPDAWEVVALRTFEKGKNKVSSISETEGKEFFRSMIPLVTEKRCLKCHAKQGYHEGDIRGGISVSILMEPFRVIEKRHIFTFSVVHGLMWAAGLVGIGLSRQRIRWSEEDRLQAVEDLRKEKDKAQKYLDIAAVILLVIDSKQNILLINKKGCEILGYDEKEFAGKNWFDNFLPDNERERAKELFARLISGERELMEYSENTVLTKWGSARLIAWHNTVLRDEEGTIVGTLSSGEDITERRQAEEEMKQLTEELRRSNEDLHQFASVVAHDLKTPLNGIGLFATYLAKHYRGRFDEKADEAIHYIFDSVERTKMLISDLLAYSRLDSRKNTFRPVNSSVALEEAIFNLRSQIEESEAELSYDLLPTIHGDASQLISLFQNLISNAIKFRSTRDLKIHISAQQEGDEWIFSVRDNGIGIESKFFDKIFNVFKRLHTSEEYEGTGIGLAICKKVVERHGGRIWVESEPDKGTTIHFTIPAKGEVKCTQSLEAVQI